MIKFQFLTQSLIELHMDEILLIEQTVQSRYGALYADDRWSQKEFVYSLPFKDKFSLGMFWGDKLIGFSIAYEYSPGWAHISRVALDPMFKSRGYGKLLLLEQLKQMQNKNIAKCSIDLVSKNKQALNLYLNLGFIIQKGSQLDNYVLERDRVEKDYIGDELNHFAMIKDFTV